MGVDELFCDPPAARGSSLRFHRWRRSSVRVPGGTCVADWGAGKHRIGERKNVFGGLPYTLYLPTHNAVSFTAETTCEIAECRVPSQARLQPHLITPEDVATSLRGGGNVSRQIVDVLPPSF